MPTRTQDGRKRLYLDFDGYFAAVEEQATPARRAVRMRMPRRDVVTAAGTGEKDGQRAFQMFAIGLTIRGSGRRGWLHVRHDGGLCEIDR